MPAPARGWKRYAVIGAGLVALPLVLRNQYHLHIVNMMGIYMILAVSLDVVLGYAGLLQLGQAAFYGVGAYCSALLVTRVFAGAWYGYWLALPLTALVTGACGLLVGIPSLRLRGHYFAIATLGFGEIVRSTLNNWVALTGGPYGLKNIPFPRVFSFSFASPAMFFYLTFATVGLVVVVARRLLQSPSGYAWLAVREDEIVAAGLGIDTYRAKAEALAISAALAGVGGWLFGAYVSYLSPMNFTLDESVLVLCMVILGGRGTAVGPLLGAALLVTVPELLRPIAQYRLLIYGAVLAVLMAVRPGGLMGKR